MIRPAVAADAPAIAAIWNPVIRDTVITFNPVEKTVEEIAALIADSDAGDWGFLVAETEGAVRGFARYFQFRGGFGYARSMEHTLYLDPQAQGRGLGHALMDALEAHARNRGRRMLIGGITGDNAASLRFHAARGFAEVGRIPDAGWKFGRFHTLVLMQKLL
ncbi:MAG: N-acetyltransferase [Rhodobacteraceae bacterium]|nr:N-acetyltransferase [Paracoccaceae bacterium]